MENPIREYSGRKFTAEDISIIIETTKAYPKLSHRELILTICELINWQSANGRAKYAQCSEFLCLLERDGLIIRPAVRQRKTQSSRLVGEKHQAEKEPNREIITRCETVNLEIVRPGKMMTQWREYVNAYHKLGAPTVFGNQIRYMITSERGDMGCLLFSGSSWALAPREEWIGWAPEEKKTRLHLIVNNSRFLILPWVQVRNLASRALSAAAKRIPGDWLEEYCFEPVLLETFVDAPYKGTCYKASNWIYLGETQGRGRNDRKKESPLTRKAIYVLPLRRDFRSILKGEKPWKAVEAHV
jgi:hypothetical protein